MLLFHLKYFHLLQVTDRFIPCVPKLLAPDGVFYLVVTKENKPGKKNNPLIF